MDSDKISQNIEYTTSTSGGPGGQHANRAETKVTAKLNITVTEGLNDTERERLLDLLGNKLTKDGELQLSSAETRSQAKNRDIVTARLLHMLKSNIRPQKKRKKSKMPAWAKRKRLNNKRQQSEKKELRKKPKLPPR